MDGVLKSLVCSPLLPNVPFVWFVRGKELCIKKAFVKKKKKSKKNNEHGIFIA